MTTVIGDMRFSPPELYERIWTPRFGDLFGTVACRIWWEKHANAERPHKALQKTAMARGNPIPVFRELLAKRFTYAQSSTSALEQRSICKPVICARWTPIFRLACSRKDQLKKTALYTKLELAAGGLETIC